uniref:GYF domain-containing protein n=1 Tax=Globodera rostochiensis TaxID=31243 RepID=A0A914HKV3_GLORO
MASIPATNNLPIAVNNNSNDAQMNFNPSWMQSTAPPMQRSLSVSNNSTSSVINAKKMVTENDETCEPIFAKHSYGREDLLAMMGKNTMKPPLGIKRCPFYMDTAQTPIILMPFSDTEMRLQQNMNSSKAMSTKKKTFSRVEPTTKSSDIWPRRTVGIGAGGVQQQQHVQAPPQAPQPLKVVASANNNFSSTANNLATAGASPPGNNNGSTGSTNGNKKATESAPPTAAATTTVAATAKEPPSLATTKASAGETLPQTAPATAKATHHWCYLDPTGVQRGPFDSQQMQAWFSSGYFSDTLRVRRKDETTYIALGELFLINGREAPFVVKTVTSLPSQQQTATFPTVQQQRISPSELREATTNATAAGQHHHHPHISPTMVDVERIWATTPLEDAVVGAGGGGGAVTASNGSTVTTAAAASSAVGGGGAATAPMTMMQSKEFKILEEQRKLREKEELLRRNEIERAAKEQRVREMESELKRQQEELSRRACEKDAEFEQRCAQMAEYERKRREELAALEQRIRAEHLQQQLRLEEEDRRRAKEAEELVRRELERQHQLVEAEMKRKRDDEDVRLRLAFQEHQQELIKEKARRAEEEQRRRLIEEQQRHQQKALDEARAERTKQQQAAAKAEAVAKAMEQQRVNSLANAQWQQQQQHQPMVNSNSYSFSQPPPPQQPPIQPPSTQQQTRATAWQTISTPLPHPIGQSPPASFLQFPFQPEQQQPIAQQQPPAVTEQRRGWQPVQLPKAAPIPPAINKPSSGGGGGANTKLAFGNKNNKQGVKHPQKGGGKQQKQQVPPPVEDKFTAWIIKRVKELNPSVDAEVFATFISGIDSPNEAEDYIIGYLGENKEVKEFHRDFLQKRIELRPRAHPQAPKDDLSRPAAAHGADSELHKGAGWASGGGASGAMTNSSGVGGAAAATTAVSNANKKKQKGQKVLDLSTLGFRPASDPNRLNAGEIDSVPPVPGGAGNKKR